MIRIGDDEDPYFEEIPEEDLYFYQRKGAKRKRRLPECIPKKDQKILNSVKRKAYRLDLQLSLCGVRLGWAGIIGLFPWVGDLLCLLLSMQVVKKASQIDGGLPAHLRLQMMFNVMTDFCIGLIPIVGDFINIMYKCNLRNFVLLEKYLVERSMPQDSTLMAVKKGPAREPQSYETNLANSANSFKLPENSSIPLAQLPKTDTFV